jgi:hypothetical protein
MSFGYKPCITFAYNMQAYYNLRITGIRTVLIILVLAILNDLVFTGIIHNLASNKNANAIDNTEQDHGLISDKCDFYELALEDTRFACLRELI